jgi:hypothetical protein
MKSNLRQSLTLRVEDRLKVFENKMLRKIMESRKKDVTGGWIKGRSYEFNDVNSLPIG